MPHLAKALADKALQSRVRQAFQHRPGFQIERDIPEDLRRKLEELDRVITVKTGI